MMFVSGMADDSDLQFLDVQSDVSFLKLNVEIDPTFQSQQRKRYLLNFEVLPGSPRMTRVGNSAVKIKVKTNHPTAQEIKFKVAFVAS